MSSPNQALRKPFQKINIITSSVNSINFAENDVDFTTFNAKCPYEKCLVNDDIVRAFNNFQMHRPSSSTAKFDAKIDDTIYGKGSKHVELDDSYGENNLSDHEFYYGGTTYYNVEEQMVKSFNS